MDDPDGDPSYRVLDSASIETDCIITHDFYDHRDADKDINIMLPVARLKQLVALKKVGGEARQHFSFMGHIKNSHLDALLERHVPEVVELLKQDQVDAVLLTPG